MRIVVWMAIVIVVVLAGGVIQRVRADTTPCEHGKAYCAGAALRRALTGASTPLAAAKGDLTGASHAAGRTPAIALDFVDPFAAQPNAGESGPWTEYAATSGTASGPNPFDQFDNLQCADGFRLFGRSCFKICPEGYTALARDVDRCTKVPEPVIKRGIFGGCKPGYVDHPRDPERCVLPAVAERAYRRR